MTSVVNSNTPDRVKKMNEITYVTLAKLVRALPLSSKAENPTKLTAAMRNIVLATMPKRKNSSLFFLMLFENALRYDCFVDLTMIWWSQPFATAWCFGVMKIAT
mmetsp:Transcript_41228/g.60315  ORF Transcript_41228/g.60315 Transcript_41228/m.60315 type:complete len:104 (-) Transcript_41228:129-440(-)